MLKQDSWEVVEGLRGEMNYTQEPPIQKGFLLKKRKWPLKGWHKVRHVGPWALLGQNPLTLPHLAPGSWALPFDLKSTLNVRGTVFQ